MTKGQTLDLLMLLSALETWAFTTGKPLPEFLAEDITNTVDRLARELVGDYE